ncbi:hypothetical protein A8B75_12345 [Sphingomonadales bacterium EhC05]|jgi:hypothetical protein|nr:hypothetical protein A8B75_12345 [Sphingomonadales bacterium EhC05]
MDASYFLNQRTKFIRYFYDESIKPFLEIKKLIEDEKAPFNSPPYSEDPEPAYLDEWLEADSAVEIVGLSCVSMLSESLKLYFSAMQNDVIRFAFSPNERNLFKELGFVGAYRAAFGDILDTDWKDCTVDFAVIEQVILARNRAQHGSDLTSMRPQHDKHTMEKHPRPIFAEKSAISGSGITHPWFNGPPVKVSRDALLNAIEEIESLAEYIEGRFDKVAEWRASKQSD